MLGCVPRFLLPVLVGLLAFTGLVQPERSVAGCSPNFHWTDFSPRLTYVIDANGGTPVRMPLGGERPSWSPDGRRIAARPRRK
jgi:hypothetical protein